MASPTLSCFSRSAALAILFAQLACAIFAKAETLQLPWCKPVPATPYESRTSKVGDTVIFNWATEAHNVYIHPNGECFDNKDRMFISETAGTSYTFLPEDVGTNVTFICSISNHCTEGQIVTFEVLDAGEDIEYMTSTPCGEGSIGEPATEAPAPVESDAESSGEMVVGWNLATTTITLLAVVGAGFFGGDLLA